MATPRLTMYVADTAITPPTNAAPTMPSAPPPKPIDAPATTATVTPRPAPEDTPNRYGSARGLRNTAW